MLVDSVVSGYMVKGIFILFRFKINLTLEKYFVGVQKNRTPKYLHIP